MYRNYFANHVIVPKEIWVLNLSVVTNIKMAFQIRVRTVIVQNMWRFWLKLMVIWNLDRHKWAKKFSVPLNYSTSHLHRPSAIKQKISNDFNYLKATDNGNGALKKTWEMTSPYTHSKPKLITTTIQPQKFFSLAFQKNCVLICQIITTKKNCQKFWKLWRVLHL